jgi:hypothetical protein
MTPSAPDVMTESSQERALLWYATIPRGYLEDPNRLTVDEKRRQITVHYRSGKIWTLDFAGFPPGTSGAGLTERQDARRAAYEHLREGERLRKAGQLDLACGFRRSRPLIPTPSRPPIPRQGGHSVGAERRPGLMVDEGGRLGHLWLAILSPSLFLQLPSPSWLCVAVGILGVEGGRPGFPRGVGRSGGAWAVARSFPWPGRFHSRGGPGGAGARPSHDGSSSGETGAWFLRRDSPLSLSS